MVFARVTCKFGFFFYDEAVVVPPESAQGLRERLRQVGAEEDRKAEKKGPERIALLRPNFLADYCFAPKSFRIHNKELYGLSVL